MRALKVLTLSLLLIVGLFTACGPSDEELSATSTAEMMSLTATQRAGAPTPTPVPTATPLPTFTPTPEPTPMTLSPRTLLENSMETLLQADSYHFEVNMQMGFVGEGFHFEMPLTFIGDFKPPDRMQGLMTMSFMDEQTELEMITIGDHSYLFDPTIGEWQSTPGENISSFTGAPIDVNIVYRKEPVLLGQEPLAEFMVYHIAATLPPEEFADTFGESNEDFDVDYWIGVEDNLLYKISVKGILAATDMIPDLGQDTTINLAATIEYSDYGKSVTIEAPEIDQSTKTTTSAVILEIDAGVSDPPASSKIYANASQGVTIYYPEEWTIYEESESGLTLLPTSETVNEPNTYVWVLFPDNMIEPKPASNSPLEDTISTLLFFLRNENITPTGPIQKTEDRAAVHFIGTMEGKPVEGIVATVRNGDYYVGVFGFTDDDMMVPVLSSIVAHLQIEIPLFSPPSEARLLVPNELLREVVDATGESRTFRIEAEKGDEYLLVVRGQENSGILGYRVFNPVGERIVRDDYVTDFISSVKLLSAMETGNYYVTVDGQGGAVLLLLPIELDTPSTLSLDRGNLNEDEVAEFIYENVTGDWVVIYAEVTGPEANERSINLELFLDDTMTQEHHPSPLEGARIVEEIVENRTYKLRVYETDGQSSSYLLYVFTPEIQDKD